MKAIMIEQYGGLDVLQVAEVGKPVVAADQILIEVHAASINPIDTKIRDGSMAFRFGKKFPKILGFDAAGVVVETGPDTTQFSPGDQVLVRSDLLTGCACAEYLAVSESVVAHKPKAMNYQQAAALPLAGLTALQGLRDDCQLQSGDHVLIIGASGGVGTYAVQIAKAMGAVVTAVCSGKNRDLVKSLGADRILDYTCEDIFAAQEPYDCIYDVMGKQRFSAARKVLKHDGHFAAAVPSAGVIFAKFIGNKFRDQQAHFVMCKSSGPDLAVMTEWVEQGRLRSIIDSTYTMDEIISAHQRIETQRSRGKLVVRVKDP
jgi:NADPH:quinone reductase-like Zn-dependent oxidoreductase